MPASGETYDSRHFWGAWSSPTLGHSSFGVLEAAPQGDASALGGCEQPHKRTRQFGGTQSSLVSGKHLIQGTFGVPGVAPRREYICFGVLEAAPCCTHHFWGAWSSPTPCTLVLGCPEQPRTTRIGFGVLGATPCCTHRFRGAQNSLTPCTCQFWVPRAALQHTHRFWGAWSSPTPRTLVLGCPEQPHTHRFRGPQGAAPPRSDPTTSQGAPSPFWGRCAPKHPLGGLDPCTAPSVPSAPPPHKQQIHPAALVSH